MGGPIWDMAMLEFLLLESWLNYPEHNQEEFFLWPSPSYPQLLSCLIVSLENESRNAAAFLAEQNVKDV